MAFRWKTKQEIGEEVYQAREMGAPADQAMRAHTQALTCNEIIPEQDVYLQNYAMPMSPITEEQAFWLRRYDRMMRRELRRRQQELHDKVVEAVASLVTAVSVGFLVYVWLLVGLA